MIPFRIDIPDSELADLRERLLRTRWPDEEPVADWSQGVPLAYLRELCHYWATEYDWRATERRLNEFAQYRTEIDGVGIHFLHVRSPHESALPLVLTHGWPGSVLEFEKAIPLLTEPDDPADAFHVVIPSLPGYGFSDRPTEPGWGVQRIASAWRELMARLGYQRYGAQGSDWGTSITTSMGQQDTGQLAGIHVMPPIAAPDPATFDDLTEAEQAALADLRHSQAHESGYAEQMTTKPQTIGYALTDSPVGLCAWIVEKFASWTDSGGNPETVLTRDEMLDGITLYWLTRTAASSARLYWESFRQVGEWFSTATDDTVAVPTGCSVFPKEMPRPSRRWAANRYTDIRHWNEPARGGHFAAWEQPTLFAEELRTFFRMVR
ncbi:epoxide hydrolase family protein [Goodfellowiella coeruleoviolacea]|uniref:Pimeloyl-ACP methyl ester carboxylesterase n=1 Tax=Goodfellowiella coeruleoviolacea TaxID=334858 RepID=A0AAE3KIE2_9PSEU|nr:epoxide hydrolase family protein [Goodfellowiella coeruleoviolacea]MCP2163178.1 Pimeloyl-ACP methyl ester carboxylesterase [Goodfellowiella coeruleoviolacea]